VHPVSIVVVAAVAVSGTVAALRAWTPKNLRTVLATPLGIGLSLSLYTLLQAVPLPAGILDVVAPNNADIWHRALLPMGESGPRWASISLDPGSTMLEVLKGVTYAGVFTMAAVICRQRSATWGAGLIFVSGVIVALVTVAHGLLGARTVYGFYAPHFAAAAWHVGPLLNPNNLAGYLNLSAMSGVGLLLSRRAPVPRWLVGLGVTLLIAVEVTSASRGGFLALPIGLVALALILRRRGSAVEESATLSGRSMALLLGATVGGGAILAILGGNQSIWEELYDKNLLKVRMLAWARPMLRDHFWLGIGRGAFESVFPAYRSVPGNVVFSHAENFPAQWMAEWGVPIGLLAMVGFAWCLRPSAISLRRTTVAASMAAGIGVLLLQNMFDLGLEVPSVSIAVAVVMGSVWGGGRRHRKGADDQGRVDVPRYWSALRGMVGVSGVILVVLAVGPCHALQDVASDRDDIYQQSTIRTSPAALNDLESHLRAAILRHPAEPYFPLVAAQVAWMTKGRNPMPALERSFERASINGRAHLLLAQILLSQGRLPQARLELRMATTDEPDLASSTAPLAVRASSSLEETLETVPIGGDGVSLLTRLIDLGPEDERLPLLREALHRAPADSSLVAKMTAHYLGELQKGAASAMCAADQRATCIREFESSVATLDRLLPRLSEADRYRAQWLVINGEPEKAEALLTARCQAADDPLPCLVARARVAVPLKDPMVLHKAIHDFMQLGCGSERQCAEISTDAGDMLATRGEWGTALTYYVRASKNEPNEARWLRIAGAASKVGAHAQAADALEKVAQIRGKDDPHLQALIQEERNQSVAPILK
jgi:tetratricopeptide (TPR) repeat protein